MFIFRKIILPFCFFLFLFPQKGFNQCCSAGNPAGGDGSFFGLQQNELRLHLFYRYSISKDYYHLDSKYQVPYINSSFYDYSFLAISYGLSERLSLHSELGYFIDKTQKSVINNQDEIIRSNGLGDLNFNVKYGIFQKVKPVTRLVLSVGIRVPIGAFNEEMNGIGIPISLQPSSGSFKYNAALFYSMKKQGKNFSWYTMAIYEMSNVIKNEFLYYDYGDYFQYSMAGNYFLTKNLLFTTVAKLEIRAKDRRENNIHIESTGSRVLYLSPQLMYTVKKVWHLNLYADFPLYKYVNGYQLTNKFAVQVGIRKDFQLKKSD